MTCLLSTLTKRLGLFCCSLVFLLTSFALPTPALANANPIGDLAGYKIVGNAGEFKAADVSFIVPDLKVSGGSVVMAVEVGSTEHVGSEVLSYWNRSTQTQVNTAFWTVWGPTSGFSFGPIDHPKPLTINAGDRIWFYIGSHATGPYDGFQITDMSSLHGTQTTATHYELSPNQYSDAASAQYEIGTYSMTASGSVTLVGCTVEDYGAVKAIGSISPQPIKLQSSNQALHISTLRNDTDFDVTVN
jgi:hypothetical protein